MATCLCVNPALEMGPTLRLRAPDLRGSEQLAPRTAALEILPYRAASIPLIAPGVKTTGRQSWMAAWAARPPASKGCRCDARSGDG